LVPIGTDAAARAGAEAEADVAGGVTTGAEGVKDAGGVHEGAVA